MAVLQQAAASVQLLLVAVHRRLSATSAMTWAISHVTALRLPLVAAAVAMAAAPVEGMAAAETTMRVVVLGVVEEGVAVLVVVEHLASASSANRQGTGRATARTLVAVAVVAAATVVVAEAVVGMGAVEAAMEEMLEAEADMV